jgi:hypothetical protein
MHTIGRRQPTMREWTELISSVHIAMAKTVARHIKQGRRPPELDFFGGEMEDVLSKADIDRAVEKLTGKTNVTPSNP